jgi:Xaa-Pro aminopeptidase
MDMPKEFRDRLERTQGILQKKGFDALIAYSDQWHWGHVRYLSNYRVLTFNADGTMWTPTLVLVPSKGEPTLFVPDNEVYLAEEVSYIKDIKTLKGGYIGSRSDLPTELKHFMDTAHPHKIAFEGLNQIPVTMYRTIEACFPGVPIEAQPILMDQRGIKSAWEIQMLEEASKITDAAISAGIHAIRDGVTEREISNTIHKSILDANSELAFGPLVGTGPRSAREVGGLPGNTKVRKGDFVLLDVGGVYEGYNGDLTRGASLGKLSKEYRDMVNVVIDGWKKAQATARVGATVADVNKASHGVVEEAGYGKYFPHEVVHGLGLEIEEPPFFPDTVIKEGMTFVVECAIYYDNKMGLRLEDMMVATSSGTRRLCKLDPEPVEL